MCARSAVRGESRARADRTPPKACLQYPTRSLTSRFTPRSHTRAARGCAARRETERPDTGQRTTPTGARTRVSTGLRDATASPRGAPGAARRDARRRGPPRRRCPVSPPRARERVAGRKDFRFPSVSSHWSHHQSCQNCQAWCQVRQVLDFRSSDHPIIVIEARGGATTRSVRNYEQSARGPHRHAVRCWSPPFET